ncbi:thioesterase domain-containing protein [Lachnospiraceae bacterium ZAX-1]
MEVDMKLLCFPHAGGFSFSYYFFKVLKLNGVDKNDVVLYEYPHRGNRLSEQQYEEFTDCVQAVIKEYEPMLENDEYILFGQSLGGYLAYEVGKILQKKYNKKSKVTIISGQMPPCYAKEYVVDYANSDALNAYLKKMDVSEDFLKKTGQSYIDLVCDDLKMFESYLPMPMNEDTQSSNIAIVFGEEDPEIDIVKLREWEKYCDNLVSIKSFPGRHFFFNECKETFIDHINKLIK